MVRPDIARRVLTEVEVAPDVARVETIRAVRIILGRQKPPETSVHDNPRVTPELFQAVPQGAEQLLD